MLRSRLMHALAATGLCLGSSLAMTCPAAAEDQPIAVTVPDFGYLDTSGEPTDQAAAHQQRLQAFMTALRGDVEADRRFHLVPSNAADGAAPEYRLRAASQAGAKILIVGGVHKVSTLVQWARAAAIDVASNRLLYEKLFTFRGDSDQAWQRAEAFVSQDMRAALAGPAPSIAAAAPAPVKLAIFDFELEDMSAAAQSTGETASDATGLADTTNAVRQLFAQSGRYHVVDVGAASAEAVKAHTLHGCDGCDAKIAQALGADQSLVGVVRRVSRTDYTVRFHIRAAQTGDVIADGDSGLRMGANYSWSRGAVNLVRDRVLESGGQK